MKNCTKETTPQPPPKGENILLNFASLTLKHRAISPFGGDEMAFAGSKNVKQKGVVFHHIKKSKFLLLFFITLISLTSCGPNYILNEEKEMENQQWTYADSLQVSVDISDTKKLYNLYIDVEHLTKYAYQNMYVQLHSIFPDGKRVTEKISLELMDKIGRWQGDCNNDDCDYRMPINEGTHFEQTGKHTFVIEQFMRKNPLEGVQSIAFRIEDTGKYLEASASSK